MSINLSVPEKGSNPELKPRITVVGVGGAGGNAVSNMIAKNLEGCDFLVCNTDSQALAQSRAEHRIQLGADVTEGLGAGSRPDVGRVAAEESLHEIMDRLDGGHMAFIAAGMGGGTGTGAAPVIARAAKEAGILTVAVVTKPFQFEGTHRMRLAEAGIEDLEQYVDTLIIIPNQNLFRIANEHTTFADAFQMADEVLYSGVRSVTDLMTRPGLINLDFADIRTVMAEMGKAMMGTGEAAGERRALDAAEAAIANPLLDDMSMKGAQGVLINITGGPDITLFEVDEAANRIRSEVDQDAYIIIGSAFDEALEGTMRVSVVATGIDVEAEHLPRPNVLTLSERTERPHTVHQLAAPEDEGQLPEDEALPAAALTEEPAPAALTDRSAAPTPAPEPEAAVPADEPAPEPAPAVRDEAEGAAPMAELAPEAPRPAVAEASETDAATPEVPADEPVNEAPEAPAPRLDRAAGTPHAGAHDAFIPPQSAGRSSQEVTGNADPFALSALTNGGAREQAGAPARRNKGASLFERVTGTGRAALSMMSGTERRDDVPRREPPVSAGSTERSRSEETPSPAPRPNPSPRPAAKPTSSAQPKLGGLDPAEQVQPEEQDEEDLLDIPAFLRRQAN